MTVNANSVQFGLSLQTGACIASGVRGTIRKKPDGHYLEVGAFEKKISYTRSTPNGYIVRCDSSTEFLITFE